MTHRYIYNKVYSLLLLGLLLLPVGTACSYEEQVATCPVSVALVYPANTIEPYRGARVELKDATASVFVDSTDAYGVAHFRVPPGIYETTSSSTLITTDWKYFFNGVKSMIIISPDSTNQLRLELRMSKKRIVH